MPVTILIIDDDPVSLELLRVLLADQGHAVEAVECGEAAMDLLQRGSTAPDAVLADCQLPGISGAALAQALRQACGPLTLILAMSGSEPSSSVIAGYDGFLLKPFQISEIGVMLAAHNRAAEELRREGTENVTQRNTDVPSSAESESASYKAMSVNAFAPAGAANLAKFPADAPVLNESIFEKLASAVPVRQLVEMYTLCVNDARQRIAMMRACITNRDSAQFVREAHAIKGSSGMLGATQLHGMAAELEKTGLEASGFHSQKDVNSLDELSAACDRLERMLGSRVQA